MTNTRSATLVLIILCTSILDGRAQILRTGLSFYSGYSNMINGKNIYNDASKSSKTNTFYASFATDVICSVKPLPQKISPLFSFATGYEYNEYGQGYNIVHPVNNGTEEVSESVRYKKQVHLFSGEILMGVEVYQAYIMFGEKFSKPVNGKITTLTAVDSAPFSSNVSRLGDIDKSYSAWYMSSLVQLGYTFYTKGNLVVSPNIQYDIQLSPTERIETPIFPINGRLMQIRLGISIEYVFSKNKSK
ncbi:MAG TPA: hypothetical protein VG603_14595 [Chitinophagales bacterium]|nr:hypothetical protein [Chitinophagales bacterium]